MQIERASSRASCRTVAGVSVVLVHQMGVIEHYSSTGSIYPAAATTKSLDSDAKRSAMTLGVNEPMARSDCSRRRLTAVETCGTHRRHGAPTSRNVRGSRGPRALAREARSTAARGDPDGRRRRLRVPSPGLYASPGFGIAVLDARPACGCLRPRWRHVRWLGLGCRCTPSRTAGLRSRCPRRDQAQRTRDPHGAGLGLQSRRASAAHAATLRRRS